MQPLEADIIPIMTLSIGIVGLPNVGKSTLFNALLKQNLALAANYPFATIEPNIGIAAVPDQRLPPLAQVVHTQVIKQATIEFVDIAGLVAGASKGEGLGNQFLSHIRNTQAIAHVLRAFSDSDVIREGSHNPLEDLSTVRLELQLADLATIEKQSAPKGSTNAKEKQRWAQIEKFGDFLRQGQNVNVYLDQLVSPEEKQAAQKIAQELNLLTAKNEIFVLNVDENELAQTDALRQKFAQDLNVSPEKIVIVSAKIEAELSQLADNEQAAFLQELGLKHSGLARLAQVAYQTLNLQSFLTAGELEVRAWTIAQGTPAAKAAGVIHTDFIDKFIKAKIANYHDFVQLGGWKAVSEAGKIRLEGKEYLMQPDDVVEFLLRN